MHRLQVSVSIKQGMHGRWTALKGKKEKKKETRKSTSLSRSDLVNNACQHYVPLVPAGWLRAVARPHSHVQDLSA